MPVIAALGEGLGDGKAEFGVETNGGGVVGFDAEGDGCVTSGTGGVDEGGQDGFAESLSTRLGGDADVGQFDLSGLEGVGVRSGQNGLGELEQDARAGNSKSQHLPGKPGEGGAQAGGEGGGGGGTEAVGDW